MAPKSLAVKGKGKDKGAAMKTRLKLADIQSTATAKEAREFTQQYTGYTFRRPKEEERAHDFYEDELCIYSRHIRDGLWLPVPESLVAFFSFFGLVPAQLAPNALVYLLGLRKMFAEKLAWNMHNVMSFVRLGSGEPGVYHLKPANHHVFGFQGTPDSVHGWKDKFFFVKKHDGDWGFPTIPKVRQGPVLKEWPGATVEVENFYKDLGCRYICLDVGRAEILPYDESPYLSKKRKAEEEVAEKEGQEVPAKRRAKSTRGKKPMRPLVSEASASSEIPETTAVDDSEDDAKAPGPAEDRDQEESSSEEESLPETAGAGSPRDENPSDEEEESEETSGSYSRPAGGGGTEMPEAAEGAAPATGDIHSPQLRAGGDAVTLEVPRGGRLVPRGNPTDFYHDVVSAMLTAVDEDYLKTRSPLDLYKLQAQLALQSTLVAGHMSHISFDKERMLSGQLRALIAEKEAAEDRAKKAGEDLWASRSAAEKEKKKLEDEAEKRIGEMESRLRAVEAQATKDRDAHTTEVSTLQVELDGVRAEKEAKVKLIAVLKEEAQGFLANANKYKDSSEALRSGLTTDLRNREAEVVALQKAAEGSQARMVALADEKKAAEAARLEAEALLEKERKAAEEEKASLVRELEEMKEKQKQKTLEGPTTSAAEAKAAYLVSEEFIELKADLCERGFNLCKYEMGSQGLLNEEQLGSLDFISVISKAISK